MTPLTIALIALAAFFLGLYLGHRWGSHDARVEADDLKRRFQRILRFAQPYIDAHAEEQRWMVDRNETGEVIDIHGPLNQCGTPALLLKEMLAERERRKSLH